MNTLSRRTLLLSATAAKLLPGQSSAPRKRIRVQLTTGHHTAPLPLYTLFTRPLFRDMDVLVKPHPNAFADLAAKAGPDVLVLYDWMDWPETDRRPFEAFLNAGKGLVVLHHAVASNQNWPSWYRNVTGGLQVLHEKDGMPASGLKQFPVQQMHPVGTHPIIRGISPFQFSRDEVFVNMWFAPGITTLLRSSDPDASKATAWIGVHPKARVVCYASGHTPEACADPMFHSIVSKSILWSGGGLS